MSVFVDKQYGLHTEFLLGAHKEQNCCGTHGGNVFCSSTTIECGHAWGCAGIRHRVF